MKFLTIVLMSILMPILANAEVHCSGISQPVCSGSPASPCPDHLNIIVDEAQQVEPTQGESVI